MKIKKDEGKENCDLRFILELKWRQTEAAVFFWLDVSVKVIEMGMQTHNHRISDNNLHMTQL